MGLHPRPMDRTPEETVRVAKAACPKGTRYLLMREELGTIFEDVQFASLFPTRGKPAVRPGASYGGAVRGGTFGQAGRRRGQGSYRLEICSSPVIEAERRPRCVPTPAHPTFVSVGTD